MGTDADGIFISASYVTGIDSAANKTFLAAMSKKFGADLKTPNDLSVPEYEARLRLQGRGGKGRRHGPGQGAEGARPRSPSTVRAARSAMNKQHHAPLTMYLGQVQADGGVKVIQSFPNVDPGAQCPNLKS